MGNYGDLWGKCGEFRVLFLKPLQEKRLTVCSTTVSITTLQQTCTIAMVHNGNRARHVHCVALHVLAPGFEGNILSSFTLVGREP